ncbi:MAG: hypothetical protein ACRDOU_02245 [Streptosporangiaceae bacterium]
MSDSQGGGHGYGNGYGAPQPPASSGNPGLYRVRLTKVSSYLIMTQQRHTVYTGTLEQLEAAARSAQTHNLLLGWWGIPFGLIWTPMALARNAKGMRQVRELAAQPG